MKVERRIFPMKILLRFWNKNKDQNGPDSLLFKAISPMFYVIRIFGLAPYRFSKGRLVSSNVYLFFTFLSFFSNTYIIFTILNRILREDHQKAVLGATERSKVLFNYVTLMIELLITISTRKKFVQVWNIIQEFDHQTRELGFPQTNKNTQFWVWAALILSNLIWMWINISGMYGFEEGFIKNIGYIFIYLGTSYSVIKFSGIVIIIGQRFKHLNQIVRKCSPDNASVVSKSVEKLRNDLMLASEKLNSVNYWTLLFWILNLSIHAVSGIYVLIMWLTQDVGPIDLVVYSCLVGWLVVHIVQLVLLNSSCHFAATEANRMDYIMLNFHRWQSNYDRRKDFEMTVHLMNYKLNFSAGGCCHVNLPLLRSITGLLTTYLIILLQLPNNY